MKFIYLLLPLVSSALADILIKCPCAKQDCSKAADSCACENQNIVNKYFCCDANTEAPKDLGLKDCPKAEKLPLLDHTPTGSQDFFRGICGGPHGLECPFPHDHCNLFNPFRGPKPRVAHQYGVCSHPDTPGTLVNGTRESTSVATSLVSLTSTVGVSSSTSRSTTTPVPVATSTVVETTTSTKTTSSTTPSVKPSNLVTVTTITSVTTTTMFTTSENSTPSPTATACGGAKDAECPQGYYCDNGGKCPGAMTWFMGWDCSGTCVQE